MRAGGEGNTDQGPRAFSALDVAGAVGLSRAEIRAWRSLGRERLAAGQAAAACDILAYACFLDPSNAPSWELLAAACLAAGRMDGASRAIAAAGGLEPTWKRAVLAALCAAARGDEVEIERWRTEARRLAASDPEERAMVEKALVALPGEES